MSHFLAGTLHSSVNLLLSSGGLPWDAGPSQARSIPSKPYVRRSLMEDWMNCCRVEDEDIIWENLLKITIDTEHASQSPRVKSVSVLLHTTQILLCYGSSFSCSLPITRRNSACIHVFLSLGGWRVSWVNSKNFSNKRQSGREILCAKLHVFLWWNITTNINKCIFDATIRQETYLAESVSFPLTDSKVFSFGFLQKASIMSHNVLENYSPTNIVTTNP